MTSRSIRVGSFGVSVELPAAWGQVVGRALRRPGRVRNERSSQGTGPLLVREPPAVAVRRRDPESGLEFIEDRIARRRAAPPDTGDGDEIAALKRTIAGYPWYHTIELPHGVVTPGVYDHRPLVSHYGIPDDLAGKRVLDVASSDGFWAFEFEAPGGTVTALDIESTADVDLPGPVRRLAHERGLADPLRDGFALAHRLLGSKVELRTGSVYDLDPADQGRFDLVHAGDLLIHLREPLRALEGIRSVTSGFALLSDCFDPGISDGRDDAGNGLTRYLGGWQTAGWWMPSLDALVQMVADAGFSDVEVVTTYSLPLTGERSGPWRAVIRARP